MPRTKSKANQGAGKNREKKSKFRDEGNFVGLFGLPVAPEVRETEPRIPTPLGMARAAALSFAPAVEYLERRPCHLPIPIA